MNIQAAIFEALESLNANKVRTGLTILGIVIGVAAVVAMLAVGAGAQDTITGSINGIGTNLLFVFPGNMQEKVNNIKPLSQGDINAISDPFQAPSVAAVAPVIFSNLNVTYGGEQTSAQVSGVTPNYESVRNEKVTEGSFITDSDQFGRASVALIGPQVADKIFGRRDGLVGESIRIEGQPFRIAGVLASKGGGSFGSQDNVVLIPLSTAQSRLIHRANDKYDIVYIQAAAPEQVTTATDEVSQILRTRHRTEVGVDDFTVMSQQDIVSTAQQITGVLTIFLGGIAAISLLVGGIGIMNIMLVSVTERTREIGLRKAIGARKRDILTQFLTESSLLSLLGGIIGIALGWLIGFIVGKVAAASGSPFNPVVSLNAILLATVFSTAVGLFFGIYPANRAANLEPVEALRYE
jgi:putative ABC transport system permease protein